MNRTRLNDVLPRPTITGIFACLANLADKPLPWADAEISPAELDVLFYYRHGERPISSFTRSYLDTNGVLNPQNIPEVAGILYDVNIRNWERLWDNYVAEYNPIDNYNMIESENGGRSITYGHVNTRADNLTHGIDTTEEYTPGSTVVTSGDIYGFNSETAVPTGKSSVVGQGGKDTTKRSGSETDSGSVTDTESGKDTHTENRTLTRHGNIGVTTSATMIRENINLWIWNFYDSVFADICKYLAIPIY